VQSTHVAIVSRVTTSSALCSNVGDRLLLYDSSVDVNYSSQTTDFSQQYAEKTWLCRVEIFKFFLQHRQQATILVHGAGALIIFRPPSKVPVTCHNAAEQE